MLNKWKYFMNQHKFISEKSSNYIFLMCTFLHLLFKLLSHHKFLNLTCHSQWILCYKFYVLWDFIMCNIPFTMIKNLFWCYFIMLKAFNFDQSSNLFSKLFIRNCNNLNILNSFHLVKIILNFFRIHILTSPDDHIFLPSNNW